jgi:hypothetical protein
MSIPTKESPESKSSRKLNGYTGWTRFAVAGLEVPLFPVIRQDDLY